MAKRAPLAWARLPIRPLRADRGARGTHNDYGSRANCRAFLPADSVSSPCGLMAGWCGRDTTRETDCVAGVVGFELRCAERKFISLTSRPNLDLRDTAQTVAVSREDNLLC